MANTENVEKIIEDLGNIPIKYCEHYEVECADNAEAENLAYEITDGMGPMVEAEAEGNMLYFRNDLLSRLVSKTDTDYANIVATEWDGIKERVKFVEDTLLNDFAK